MIVVHVTHETVEKIGGIGAVIGGLVTTKAYNDAVGRTILVGPLLQTDRTVENRLGVGAEMLYSSIDGIKDCDDTLARRFRAIESSYDVSIIYGRRNIEETYGQVQANVEVLLVDVFHFNKDRLNLFKGELFKKFNIASKKFEQVWEYEEYVRLAEPAFEALVALGCGGSAAEPVVYLAHEYMGMPLALKVVLDGTSNTRTVFYAHEVASVRPLVELHEGHDLMFYNVLEKLAENGQVLEDVFPEVNDNYKHPLVRAARYLDHIFAVGDYICKELRVLDRHFTYLPIDLVYNGIPARRIDLKTKRINKGRMASYAESLFGDRPDWILTHVARPVISKAVWRDLGVLHEMEPLLKKRGERAAYFMLGSLGGQRRGQDIRQMERVYGWPVHHEQGYPDLSGGEEVLLDLFENFNRDHEYARVVLVNQFGWSRELCGRRMPEDMTFVDIRQGTDVEFGMSIYEPFGISQLEPLSFGAICVPTNVCGCMGFVRAVTGGGGVPNVLEADFTRLAQAVSIEQAKQIGTQQRNQAEAVETARIANELMKHLPRTDKQMQQFIDTGWELARQMSWEQVVNQFVMPALQRTSDLSHLEKSPT
ncbi:MAG: hypothetical protein HQ546_10990 [Planctomycetes bacterium]|nr:hypothetical protein [Planctomycetota bacterium]